MASTARGREEPPTNDFCLTVVDRALHGSTMPTLVPIIDGHNFSEDTFGGRTIGRDPDLLLGDRSPLLPTEWPEPDPQTILWRCCCGIEGCGFVSARISRESVSNDYDHIVWSDWTVHCVGNAEPPELRFHTRQYFAELIRCHTDRFWESNQRRLARKLAATLDADPSILGQWGCSAASVRGLDNRAQIHLLLRSGEADHTLTFPVSDDADCELLRELVAALGAQDPRELAEHSYQHR